MSNVRNFLKHTVYLKLPYIHNSKQTNDTINNINQKLPKIQICPKYETNKTKDLFKTKSKDADSVRANVVYVTPVKRCISEPLNDILGPDKMNILRERTNLKLVIMNIHQ